MGKGTLTKGQPLSHSNRHSKRGVPYLTGAVSGGAEVTGVVVAVSLMLRLQASAVVVSHDCPVMLHTADCTILGAAATGLCTGFPRTHLRPAVMQITQLLLRGILLRMTAVMSYLQPYGCRLFLV